MGFGMSDIGDESVHVRKKGLVFLFFRCLQSYRLQRLR